MAKNRKSWLQKRFDLWIEHFKARGVGEAKAKELARTQARRGKVPPGTKGKWNA